jgi:membrane peptidoglycan carboxypeptidase
VFCRLCGYNDGVRIWWNRWPIWVKALIIVFFLVVLTGIGIGLYFLRDLPSPTKLQSADSFAVSTKIFDRNNELLYEIFADENRTPIKMSDLSPYVAQATIAIEDKNFYKHFGIDFAGVARALIVTAQGKSLQGGSTLTQQLIKVSLLTRERTLERKAKEAVLTLAAEAIYSKDEILEMYLNHIPYGGTAWGIEAAAHTFFDKSAKDLTLAESAYLAGLPQSPSRYSPFGNTPELGKERQKEVLRRMMEDKHITKEQAEQAEKEELKFAQKRITIKAPHFVFYVRDQLVEQYGEAVVERGGLRVTTTLDLALHETVQASVSAEINKLARYKVGNGAALVTRPSTGEILAMVGSRDYFSATHEGQINITVRERQPGSSIKPLDVATALQLRKLTPSTMLLDIPTCFQNIGQSDYCPKNYDGTFHGPVLPRQALANSYNIPAVKTLGVNSLDSFMATASAMGLSTLKDPARYGLALSLGGGEVKMVDMATAFGTIANQGVKVPLIGITKIEDYRGKVLYETSADARKEQLEKALFLGGNTSAQERTIPTLRISENRDEIYRVLDKEVSYIVSDILSDNGARAGAFGLNSELNVRGQKVAAKTGTTNDLRDNWTVGYTPQYLAIVWVGNNDNTKMNQSLVSGVTGAAPIWNDIMTHITKKEAPIWPEKPENITTAKFCKRSGALPNPATPADKQCEEVSEIFWKGTEPQSQENVWHGTWIAGQTGLPPREGDPTDQLRFEEHILLSDPFTRDYCLDCSRATVEITKEDGTKEMKPVEEKYYVPGERLFQIQYGFTAWPSLEQEQQPQ